MGPRGESDVWSQNHSALWGCPSQLYISIHDSYHKSMVCILSKSYLNSAELFGGFLVVFESCGSVWFSFCPKWKCSNFVWALILFGVAELLSAGSYYLGDISWNMQKVTVWPRPNFKGTFPFKFNRRENSYPFHGYRHIVCITADSDQPHW